MTRRSHAEIQQPLGFPGGGVCPKAFEKCRRCGGNKLDPHGAPGHLTHIPCEECRGEGVKLYPEHTMERTGETFGDGAREMWKCTICFAKEIRPVAMSVGTTESE